MRVLIISNAIPHFPGSGSPVREYCLASELAQHHHITYLLPAYSEEHRAQAASLAAFCEVRFYETRRPTGTLWYRLQYSFDARLPWLKEASRAVTGSPRIVQDIKSLFPPLVCELRKLDWARFDLLQIEHSHLAHVARRLSRDVPLVVDWHNVNAAIARRTHAAAHGLPAKASTWIEWRKTETHERYVVKRADKSLVVSAAEADRLRRMHPGVDVSVVPNGCKCEYFANPQPVQTDPATILFTGVMDYEPNIEAVLHFCREIFPLVLDAKPAATFVVAGARPPSEIKRLEQAYPGRVLVTGYVEDMRPLLQQATVCVVPLLNGGGTRLKILEAMSMQKAVVSSPVGCEGLNVQEGRDILIADRPEDFARRVMQILDDQNMRSALAARGHEMVQRTYNWRQIASLADAAWQETLAKHASQRHRGRLRITED